MIRFLTGCVCLSDSLWGGAIGADCQRLGSQGATQTPPDLSTAPQVFYWFIVQSYCWKISILIKQRVWPFVLRKNNFNGNVISYFTRNWGDCAVNPLWMLMWSNSFINHAEWRLHVPLILRALWILKSHFKHKFDAPLGPVGRTLSIHSIDMHAHSLHENMWRKAPFNAEKPSRAILSTEI